MLIIWDLDLSGGYPRAMRGKRDAGRRSLRSNLPCLHDGAPGKKEGIDIVAI